jgi:hypothetical protein
VLGHSEGLEGFAVESAFAEVIAQWCRIPPFEILEESARRHDH